MALDVEARPQSALEVATVFRRAAAVARGELPASVPEPKQEDLFGEARAEVPAGRPEF